MSADDDADKVTPPAAPFEDEAEGTQLFMPAKDGGAVQASQPPSGQAEEEPTQFVSPSVPPAQPRKEKEVAKVTVGTLINNNYEVKEVLNAGGMGEVYRGENVFTGDPVAIKVVLPELAEDETVGLMFMREARTLSQLSDDAIVRYYNFVKDPAIDRYCLIMEFIRGLPLSDYTAQNGPLTKESATALMRRLAKGLQKAHASGVIHRDLSPDNVMLPDGIVAEALLIDFGIAKSSILQEGTMAGQFAGKFKYVSPEQLGHYGGEIGPPSDIYGLALMMSAALLGKPLDMGSSVVEAVKAREGIPDLSALPEIFRPILSYMLEPDPSDRASSMAEVVWLLDNPQEIPAKYRAGLTIPQSTVEGLTVPPTLAVGGLQRPPTTASGVSLAPRPLEKPTPQAKPKDQEGLGVIGLLLGVFLMIFGGATYYAWKEGLIFPSDPSASNTPDPQNNPPTPVQQPSAQTNSREGFLAAFDAGDCAYATRVSSGPNAGMVQGFASRENAFANLPAAYEEKFGSRPNVFEQRITSEQCSVLDLAHSQQSHAAEPITLAVNKTQLESGGELDGQITDPLGRHIWLVLISPKGAVYNLVDRLSEPVGNRSRFRFSLSLSQGTTSARQLILAIATPEPLVSAASARQGTPAADLMPLIAQEMERNAGAGAVSLAYVEVVTPQPEETPQETNVPEDDADLTSEEQP